MVFTLDVRVPVWVVGLDEAGAGDAVLVEGRDFQPGAGHVAGCACCAPRTEVGRALAGLLQDRARGKVAFFNRVIVALATEAGHAELEAALTADPVAQACFRRV